MDTTKFTIIVLAVNVASVIVLALLSQRQQTRALEAQQRVADENMRSAHATAELGFQSNRQTEELKWLADKRLVAYRELDEVVTERQGSILKAGDVNQQNLAAHMLEEFRFQSKIHSAILLASVEIEQLLKNLLSANTNYWTASLKAVATVNPEPTADKERHEAMQHFMRVYAECRTGMRRELVPM